MSDDPFAPIDSTCKGTSEKAADAPVAWIAIIPVPDGAPAAFPAHPKLGKPSARWRYTDAAGALLGFACRFDLRNGEKQFRPLTYGRRGAAGEPEWRWESWPPKRPLYGLAELAQGIGMRQKSAITTMLLAPTFFAMHKRHRWREDNRRISNGEQVGRIAGLAMASKRSIDFCGYWQRHIKGLA
jgi:hypothetical protein